MKVTEHNNEMFVRFGQEEAELKAEQQLVDAYGALKRLEDNEDFKLLIKFITKDKVLAYNDLLAFQVEERGQLFEELVWRSQLSKELASLSDLDVASIVNKA
jgi:hypothetical protein